VINIAIEPHIAFFNASFRAKSTLNLVMMPLARFIFAAIRRYFSENDWWDGIDCQTMKSATSGAL
jgi:hypothetical protein